MWQKNLELINGTEVTILETAHCWIRMIISSLCGTLYFSDQMESNSVRVKVLVEHVVDDDPCVC